MYSCRINLASARSCGCLTRINGNNAIPLAGIKEACLMIAINVYLFVEPVKLSGFVFVSNERIIKHIRC